MRRSMRIAGVVGGVLLVAGCGDPLDRLLANDTTRTRLQDKMAGSTRLAAEMADRLLAADSTRTAVLDRMMASAEARQEVLTRVAKDRTLMEGAIQYAVQDSSRREELKALFRGMEMGGGR